VLGHKIGPNFTHLSYGWRGILPVHRGRIAELRKKGRPKDRAEHTHTPHPTQRSERRKSTPPAIESGWGPGPPHEE